MTGFLTPTHILLLLLVVLMLFGAKRLPEFGRSLGSGLREFRHSISGAPTSDEDTGGTEAKQLQSAENSAGASAAPPPPAA